VFSSAIIKLADAVVQNYSAQKQMIATAESCTGGLISGALTAISGSSAVVDRGFTTYSNEAKAEMLGVPMALIMEHGAVSEPVARAMVDGALTQSRANVAVAVTGIAGPGGGSREKPVGLVYIAVQRRDIDAIIAKEVFAGLTRDQVREETVLKALKMLLAQLTP